jgi:riboflavin synthase
MFTGIVRERGRLAAIDAANGGLRLTVEAPQTAAATAVGDSISINGLCLTAAAVDDGTLAFDAVPETLARSALDSLTAGCAVNLEPALRIGDSLGGHYVQGHVDGVGRVRSLEREGDDARFWIDAPPEILRLCVEKGSITVDGVALTITDIDDSGFATALVPHTLALTTLGELSAGTPVNLEADIIAKYVERLLPPPR